MKKVVVFTDLDGTLLDYSTYSFEKAVAALQLLKERDIPVIISSSKTSKEILFYREKLENHHPFISENGGGIFIPKDYFSFKLPHTGHEITEENDYIVMRLGAPYSDLRKTLQNLRGEGFNVKGFGDMTVQEIAEIANISTAEARMAQERDFDEPFIFEAADEEVRRLFEAITVRGFQCTKGQFFHILGNTDKGKAVSIFIGLYERALGEVTTIALGDSPNDIPMLESVEYPIIVQRPDKTYAISTYIPRLRRIDGVGAEGWNKAIIELLSELGE
jgi:mannosyl-3-phosphoglycerate phosphatase